MRYDFLKPLSLAAAFALPIAASAQYNQGPQPYNPQDPQNYGAPASQSYPGQQQGYDQPQYPQSGQQQIYEAPPPLPQYDQPLAPGDGYIWTPGYWAFGPGGYYWVNGAWVLAPYEDALWTPGYWGYAPTGYFWNAGYWGPEVGYYGGINYGFGYFGVGFYGGCWREHRFFYNSYYSHIGGGFRNVYGERFNDIRDAHPRGNSFTTIAYKERSNEFRNGSYNGAGRDYNQHQAPVGRGYETRGGDTRGFESGGTDARGPDTRGFGTRGPETPNQPGYSRPAAPGTAYSGMQHPYANPVERGPQQVDRPRGEGANGAFGRPSMPSAPANQQRYSAPMEQQRYSQPAYQQHQAPAAPPAYQQHQAPAMQQQPQAPRGGGGGPQFDGGGPRGGGGPQFGGGGGGGPRGGGGGGRR